jgi:hypothetical protein
VLSYRLMPDRHLALDSFRGEADHQRFVREAAGELARRRSIERSLLATTEATFVVNGWCRVCERSADFLVDWQYSYDVAGVPTPNWRERLLCPHCRLNARMRATIHLIEEVVPRSGTRAST